MLLYIYTPAHNLQLKALFTRLLFTPFTQKMTNHERRMYEGSSQVTDSPQDPSGLSTGPCGGDIWLRYGLDTAQLRKRYPED